ncbi:MAG: hypothetical protein ABI841_04495 [Chloroflexota bacterium]
MSQAELLARMVRHLNGAGIPHMVVGSLASSFHAEPRTTRDIDLVIDPTADALRRFVEALPASDFYVDMGAAREAFDRRSSFNVVELESGWKVDLMMRRDRPFSREEMDRRIAVRLLGTDTHVATAEDTIIAKLEWAKVGASERQLQDIAGILWASDALDSAYIERWVSALDLADVWERAQRLTATARVVDPGGVMPERGR